MCISMAVSSNNAKHCYNRIVLIIATFCLCRLGAPKCSSKFKAWSPLFMGCNIMCGQVMVIPPTCRAEYNGEKERVSCHHHMHNHSTGMHTHRVWVYRWCQSLHHMPPTQSPQCGSLYATVSLAEGRLIFAMGSALVPEKCFWYLIEPIWKQGAWQYEAPSTNYCLQVPNNAGNMITIPQLPMSKACHMLGVWLALDRNDEEEFRHLQEVARQWQTSMANAKVTHSAAKFGLCQVILCKLEYPLVATTLSTSQCTAIMCPILVAGLPTAGYTRTFPWAIIHRLCQ